jgi:hypothetical protein
MKISKIDREIVRMKFGGKCAYSGTELEHDWQVDYDSITILGPYIVDKIDEDVYNIETNETIELKPRPPFVATTAWPFSG